MEYLLIQAVGCCRSRQLLAILVGQLERQPHIFLLVLQWEGCWVLVLLHWGPLHPTATPCAYFVMHDMG